MRFELHISACVVLRPIFFFLFLFFVALVLTIFAFCWCIIVCTSLTAQTFACNCCQLYRHIHTQTHKRHWERLKKSIFKAGILNVIKLGYYSLKQSILLLLLLSETHYQNWNLLNIVESNFIYLFVCMRGLFVCAPSVYIAFSLLLLRSKSLSDFAVDVYLLYRSLYVCVGVSYILVMSSEKKIVFFLSFRCCCFRVFVRMEIGQEFKGDDNK